MIITLLQNLALIFARKRENNVTICYSLLSEFHIFSLEMAWYPLKSKFFIAIFASCFRNALNVDSANYTQRISATKNAGLDCNIRWLEPDCLASLAPPRVSSEQYFLANIFPIKEGFIQKIRQRSSLLFGGQNLFTFFAALTVLHQDDFKFKRMNSSNRPGAKYSSYSAARNGMNYFFSFLFSDSPPMYIPIVVCHPIAEFQSWAIKTDINSVPQTAATTL